MAPRETENNANAKFWDDKQRVLWYVMVFSGVVNYQPQQQQQNFINKQITLKKYCPQLARLFKGAQCVQNIKIETKTINIIILSRGPIQLSGYGKLRMRYLPVRQIKNEVLASQSL